MFYLKRRSNADFDLFLIILIQNNQEHVAKKLRKILESYSLEYGGGGGGANRRGMSRKSYIQWSKPTKPFSFNNNNIVFWNVILKLTQRLRVLKWSSLEHRRIIADQSFLFNIFVGDIHVDLASIFNILPPTVTRFHNMRLLRPRTNYKTTDQTFIVRVVSTWNSLLPDILSSQNSRECLNHHIQAHHRTTSDTLLRHT